MQQAIVAIEDSRFYEHGGIDPRGLVRALVSNSSTDGEMQGASTLTQQYVKNVLLETAVAEGDKDGAEAATEQTKARKIREIRMAIEYEKHHTKDQILEGYLNIANFGSSNYGVEAAAAVLLQHQRGQAHPAAGGHAGRDRPEPETSTRPVQGPGQATKPPEPVLGRMPDLGMITAAQTTAAEADPAAAQEPQPRNRAASTPATTATSATTSLNTLLTRTASSSRSARPRRSAAEHGPPRRPGDHHDAGPGCSRPRGRREAGPDHESQIGAAAVTVEPGTGNVIAMVQNRIYYNTRTAARGAPRSTTTPTRRSAARAASRPGRPSSPSRWPTWLSAGQGLNDHRRRRQHLARLDFRG